MALSDHIGKIKKLTVVRTSPFGYFLSDGQEDVLLHLKETDQELAEGNDVDVFLYTDSQGRIAATTFLPEITVGKYGWAAVSDVNPKLGVFVNIGINKDILIGEDDLPAKKSVWPKKGDLLCITLRTSRNNRIYGKLANDEVIDQMRIDADQKQFNKNIEGHIYRTAKVGSWAYTVEGFKGFIHESQRGKEPRLGEKIAGRIIEVKEDGTVNISLLRRKHEALDEDAEKIYSYLISRNGAMPYWDKSLPEDIQEKFSMSKAAFKRALGKLMKEKKVYQENGWTYIVENKE